MPIPSTFNGGINSGGCNGGGITGVFPLNHWLGAVVDVSGCKISINAPNLSGDSLTYLIGPRFSYQPQRVGTYISTYWLGEAALPERRHSRSAITLTIRTNG
ncbi:MAG: hypothetical protein U0V70_21835 [Terriglobia bacterium]